jgi:hypothetical protein
MADSNFLHVVIVVGQNEAAEDILREVLSGE